MAATIQLVGREDELRQIDALVGCQGARLVLFLAGEGGVGKTRLLEEIQQRYAGPADNVLTTDIIDFDDRSLHLWQNIAGRMMAYLSSTAMRGYAGELLQLQRLQQSDASPEEVDRQRQAVYQAVVDNLNRVASERRIVMLFDTLDKLEAPMAWERLAAIMRSAENVLFVLAGRNAKALRADFLHLYPDLEPATRFMGLRRLRKTATLDYLTAKQQQLNITIDRQLANRIASVTAGKPILIDMAVEWLAHNIAIDWLTSPERWAQYKADRKRAQRDFQKLLVEPVGQVRTRMDRLILLMSRIYPVNAEMVAEALDLADREAVRHLLEQAQDYAFVKSFSKRNLYTGSAPGADETEYVYLHDEVRRMVRDFVWPSLDPDGARRALDSQLAVAYLQAQSEHIEHLLAACAEQTVLAQETGDPAAEFDAFIRQQTLSQEQWAVREQILFHSMYVDPTSGVRLFTKLFDEATKAYEYAMREILLEQMQGYQKLTDREPYLAHLTAEQTYDVEIRRAKFLLDDGRYRDAEQLLHLMLKRRNLEPPQQVDVYIQLANVVVRLGQYSLGAKFFGRAVRLSQQHNLQSWLVKAENGLGWAYRILANLGEAQRHYEAALAIARAHHLAHDQALLYSNLGFVYAYNPTQRERAASFCRASLTLWEQEGDKRGIGRAHSAFGCVNFMDGEFDEALTHFQQALDIFEPAGDREWLSTVFSWRAAVYMSTQCLDLAEADLLRSLRMNVAKDRPMSLSRLGSLYMMRNELDKAADCLKECRDLALKQKDVLYQLVSIRDLARLARRQHDFDQLAELEDQLRDYKHEWGEPTDRRSLGMLYINFGSLALGQGRVDDAVAYYSKGLAPLAELGRYGGDSLDVHVSRLEQVLTQSLGVSPATIRRVGSALLNFWLDKHLDTTHPDVTIHFEQWSAWGQHEHEFSR